MQMVRFVSVFVNLLMRMQKRKFLNFSYFPVKLEFPLDIWTALIFITEPTDQIKELYNNSLLISLTTIVKQFIFCAVHIQILKDLGHLALLQNWSARPVKSFLFSRKESIRFMINKIISQEMWPPKSINLVLFIFVNL